MTVNNRGWVVVVVVVVTQIPGCRRQRALRPDSLLNLLRLRSISRRVSSFFSPAVLDAGGSASDYVMPVGLQRRNNDGCCYHHHQDDYQDNNQCCDSGCYEYCRSCRMEMERASGDAGTSVGLLRLYCAYGGGRR